MALTFGSLFSLHIGWNLNMLFILDGDSKGKEERDRYVKEYGLPESSTATIDELVNDVKEIEDLLDDDALSIISNELELLKKPTKNQIRRFFQECLARDDLPPLGKGFENKATSMLDKIKELFDKE